MKRIFIFVLLAFFTLEIPTAFGGDSFYYEQRLRVAESSVQILIKHGLCIDNNDCVKKTLVLAGGMPSGISVELYDIHDASAVKEIIGLCMDEYEKNARNMSVNVVGYREKHEDVMGLIKPLFISPYIKLYVKGEK